MGLMTLITRKINPEKQERAQLRAPPYERKVSSRSPVRLVRTVSPSGVASGVSGVSGTSPSFPKQPRGREHPLSPLSQSSSTDSAAPAPVILGFRGDEVPSKPSTPSNGKHQTESWRGNTSASLQPSIPKPPSRLSQIAPPRSRSSVINTQSAETVSQKLPLKHRSLNSISSNKAASFIKTSSSSKGYVDILDAQSEFKPSNFHSRVKAAGARDYGEDVADRNIGANGCNLDSLPVQAFYASNLEASNHSMEQRRPVSSWDRPPLYKDEEDDLRRRIMKQTSIDSALWSKSLNQSHQSMLNEGQTPVPLAAGSIKKKRAGQRESFNDLAPSASSGEFGAAGAAEIDAIHAQRRMFYRNERGRSLQISASRANQLVSAWDTTSPESVDSSPDPTSPNVPRSTGSLGGLSRSLSVSSEKISNTASRNGINASGPQFGVNNQPILSPQPTSFRLSAAVANSAFTKSSQRPSTASGIPARQPVESTDSPQSIMPDLSNLPHHLKERARSFKEDWHDDMTDRESAPSPFVKTARSRSQSREDVHDSSLVKKTVTPRPQSQAGETEEQTPERARSTRHWSLTSTAPTTSSSSSATYPRPLSRHTANTSIDLSTTTLSSTNSSAASVKSDNSGHLPIETAYDEKLSKKANAKRSLTILRSPSFNIDDYVSSDDDSFIGSGGGRGESEEDLLFNNGYGAHGMQLPGLEDAFAAPSPVVMLRSPHFSVSTPNDNLRQTYGSPPSMGKTGRHREATDGAVQSTRSPTRRRSASALESAMRRMQSHDAYDRPQSPVKRSETKRLSALLGSPTGHTHHSSGALSSKSHRYHPHLSHHQLHHRHHGSNVGEEVIEEEKFEKVDIATAIRLRKEAKARKRASQMSIASQILSRELAKTISADSSRSSADEADGSALRSSRDRPRTATVPAIPSIADVPELA